MLVLWLVLWSVASLTPVLLPRFSSVLRFLWSAAALGLGSPLGLRVPVCALGWVFTWATWFVGDGLLGDVLVLLG